MAVRSRPVIRNYIHAKWRRGLTPSQRENYANYLRNLREKVPISTFERTPSEKRSAFFVWNEERNAKEYAVPFGLTQKQLLARVKKSIQHHGKVRVLDIGCGEGLFLRWLKDTFRSRIATTGIGVRFKKKLSGVDNYRVALAERFVRPNHFDFIFSMEGVGYSVNQILALENIYASLRVGGWAFVHVNIPNRRYVMQAMRQQGLRPTSTYAGVLIFRKNSTRRLDLSSCYPSATDTNFNILNFPEWSTRSTRAPAKKKE